MYEVVRILMSLMAWIFFRDPRPCIPSACRPSGP